MSTLRIRLTSWQDLGSPSVAGITNPGDELTVRVRCTPSLAGGGVVSDGLHTVSVEDIPKVTCPWTYDLLDPTDANPSGWGWTIRLSSGPFSSSVIVPLTAELIAAQEQVDGVRTIDLAGHVGLSSITAQGGLLTPARGIETMAVDSTSGELSAAMTDGTVQDAPGLPAAIEALVSGPVKADADRAADAVAQITAAAQTATDQATAASNNATASAGSATTATQQADRAQQVADTLTATLESATQQAADLAAQEATAQASQHASDAQAAASDASNSAAQAALDAATAASFSAVLDADGTSVYLSFTTGA